MNVEPKPKVVTICGSMRYTQQMIALALELELRCGWVVLQCAYDFDKKKLTEMDFAQLSASHCHKIDLSDAVYIVNIDGYIGASTRAEILYATRLSKEIIYHEQR